MHISVHLKWDVLELVEEEKWGEGRYSAPRCRANVAEPTAAVNTEAVEEQPPHHSPVESKRGNCSIRT